MKTSKAGIELIKKYEGLRLASYVDSAGVLTIGYGHTGGVKMGDVITKEEAERLLIEDLSVAENEINRYGLNLCQNQFDALVSFVYNVGIGNFRKSTLLKKLLADPNDPTIASEFNRWIYAGGRVLQGLVKRRSEEARLYFS